MTPSTVRPIVAEEQPKQATKINVEDALFSAAPTESTPTKGIEADVTMDEKGNYHIVIPASMDWRKVGVTENGNFYVGVKTEPLTLKFVKTDPNGKVLDNRELETYGVSFRLGLRMKAK